MKLFDPRDEVERDLFRLAGMEGAALFLTPVVVSSPPNNGNPLQLNFDISILTPDRKVKYLIRPTGENFLHNLSLYMKDIGNGRAGENDIASFQDSRSGLLVDVFSGFELTVELRVSVIQDLHSEFVEHDIVIFTMSRFALLKFSDALDRFSSDLDVDEINKEEL